MTREEQLDRIIFRTTMPNLRQLYIGYLRYEALRKLHASEYTKLCTRNCEGERFDDMVDDLILKGTHD